LQINPYDMYYDYDKLIHSLTTPETKVSITNYNAPSYIISFTAMLLSIPVQSDVKTNPNNTAVHEFHSDMVI